MLRPDKSGLSMTVRWRPAPTLAVLFQFAPSPDGFVGTMSPLARTREKG
jgi:hypothetical protein